jgi:hypothetical protein
MNATVTDAEIFELALEPDIDLVFERVMRMSDEEIRQSLIARGHDLRVLEAEASVLYNMYKPKKRGVRNGHLATAVAFVGGMGAMAAAVLGPFASAAAPMIATTRAPAPATAFTAAGNPYYVPPPPTLPAYVLRDQALAACKRGEWKTCLEKLDQARAIQPQAEAYPDVAAARKQAEDALARQR